MCSDSPSPPVRKLTDPSPRQAGAGTEERDLGLEAAEIHKLIAMGLRGCSANFCDQVGERASRSNNEERPRSDPIWPRFQYSITPVSPLATHRPRTAFTRAAYRRRALQASAPWLLPRYRSLSRLGVGSRA